MTRSRREAKMKLQRKAQDKQTLVEWLVSLIGRFEVCQEKLNEKLAEESSVTSWNLYYGGFEDDLEKFWKARRQDLRGNVRPGMGTYASGGLET